MRKAFTLLEVLVSIAIIAILLSLSVTALRGSKDAALSALNLSQLRQTYIDFQDWAASPQDQIVNAGAPDDASQQARAYYGALWGSDRGWGMYLAQNELWPKVLNAWHGGAVAEHWHSTYSDDPAPAIALNSANRPSARPLVDNDIVELPDGVEVTAGAILNNYQTEYRLGRTLLTSAHIWMNPGFVSKKQWSRMYARTVRFTDVASPSGKGLLYHNEWPGAEKSLHHVAFCDGSVSLRNFEDARPTSVLPFETSGAPGDPVDATFNGYLGIDF
ncbi:MAG: type II secretion system protein [Planctomycetota bacterium]|nr:type II secretion system protein [Planctomycetota bacterium]